MTISAQIKLPHLNRRLVLTTLAENLAREDRKVLMNFWAHFNFPSRGIHFCCLPMDLRTEISC